MNAWRFRKIYGFCSLAIFTFEHLRNPGVLSSFTQARLCGSSKTTAMTQMSPIFWSTLLPLCLSCGLAAAFVLSRLPDHCEKCGDMVESGSYLFAVYFYVVEWDSTVCPSQNFFPAPLKFSVSHHSRHLSYCLNSFVVTDVLTLTYNDGIWKWAKHLVPITAARMSETWYYKF